jgi:hypothetical protein
VTCRISAVSLAALRINLEPPCHAHGHESTALLVRLPPTSSTTIVWKERSAIGAIRAMKYSKELEMFCQSRATNMAQKWRDLEAMAPTGRGIGGSPHSLQAADYQLSLLFIVPPYNNKFHFLMNYWPICGGYTALHIFQIDNKQH